MFLEIILGCFIAMNVFFIEAAYILIRSKKKQLKKMGNK